MNNCTIYGHLGQDSEFVETKGGTKILKFSLANTTGFAERKKTNWFSCVAFGERWERTAQYLKKGSAVVVSGEVTLETWEDKDGVSKSKLSLNVRELSFAGSNKDKEQSAPSQERKTKVELNQDGMPNW